MGIEEEILQMIGAAEFVFTPVAKTSNLYLDLGYDSLAFVRLLLEIEEAYSVQFELLEMGACLQAERLITLVKQKTKESEDD